MFKKIPKAPKAPKPPKIKVQKTRKIGNRTLIGILSIVVALFICFGVAPVINRVADSKTEIVRAQKLFRDFSILKKQFFVRFKAEKSRFCGGYLQKPIDRGGGVV